MFCNIYIYIYIYVVNDGRLLCIRDFFSVFGHLFLHKLVDDSMSKCDAIFEFLHTIICVQKDDLYRTCRKNGYPILNVLSVNEHAAKY